MIIGIDFDGTCVTHKFPELGEEIGAAPVLKKLVAAGHELILFTMRGNKKTPKDADIGDLHPDEDGKFLTMAVDWFKSHNIPLYGIQTNPTQHVWTDSPKAYCHMYIDDAALGCPVIEDPRSGRVFVNWEEVEQLLIAKKII